MVLRYYYVMMLWYTVTSAIVYIHVNMDIEQRESPNSRHPNFPPNKNQHKYHQTAKKGAPRHQPLSISEGCLKSHESWLKTNRNKNIVLKGILWDDTQISQDTCLFHWVPPSNLTAIHHFWSKPCPNPTVFYPYFWTQKPPMNWWLKDV